MSADVKLAGQTFTIIPNILTLNEIALQFEVQGNSFNATISGAGSIGSINFNATIKKEGSSASATASIPSASLTQLASSLGSAGSDVASFMSSVGLSDFNLNDIVLNVKTLPRMLSFKATASYKTLPDVQVEFLVYQPNTNDSTIALAMETNPVSLSNVVSAFVDGVDISDVPFIGSASLPAASVLLVNRKLPTGVVLPFSTPSLSELSSSLTAGSRISALFPLNFPRAGMKNLQARIRSHRLDFRVSHDTIQTKPLCKRSRLEPCRGKVISLPILICSC